jgi:hypothetical protein
VVLGPEWRDSFGIPQMREVKAEAVRSRSMIGRTNDPQKRHTLREFLQCREFDITDSFSAVGAVAIGGRQISDALLSGVKPEIAFGNDVGRSFPVSKSKRPIWMERNLPCGDRPSVMSSSFAPHRKRWKNGAEAGSPN